MIKFPISILPFTTGRHDGAKLVAWILILFTAWTMPGCIQRQFVELPRERREAKEKKMFCELQKGVPQDVMTAEVLAKYKKLCVSKRIPSYANRERPNKNSDISRLWSCERKIKNAMHDSASYQYVSATKTNSTITVKFRGKNAFGGVVLNSHTCND